MVNDCKPLTSPAFTWVTGAIPADELSVTVTHSLGSMPVGYCLVANNEYAVGKIFVQRGNIFENTAVIEINASQPVDAEFLFGVN